MVSRELVHAAMRHSFPTVDTYTYNRPESRLSSANCGCGAVLHATNRSELLYAYWDHLVGEITHLAGMRL